jgi:SEC-C motif-containing protein
MKSGRLRIYNYAITGEPKECDHDEHYSREIEKLLDRSYRQIQKKKHSNPQWLLKLIEKYPRVPAFKNYLTVFYTIKGERGKAHEANHWLIKEHPDYLFGKLNLAAEYLEDGRLEEIPKVMGQALDLQDLYPERKVFHLTEFSSFLNISCRYLIESGNFEAVESRLEPARKVLGEDHEVIQTLHDLMDKREQKFFSEKRQALFDERGGRENGKGYDISVQTDVPPIFHHPEINALYEHGLRIDHGVLRNILALPRQTLLADLETVLTDSLRRYEYFDGLVEEIGWEEDRMTFPLHAIFLLTEMKAVDKLPAIFDLLSQGDDFLDFWFNDHITETLWHCLFHLGQSELDIIRSFMLERDVDFQSKEVLIQAMEQVALQVPEKKAAAMQWFDEVLAYFHSHLDDPFLIDISLISSLVTTAALVDAEKFLPVAKKFYNLHLVDWNFAGNYEALSELAMDETYNPVYKVFPNIFDHYQNILTTWHGYMPDEEKERRKKVVQKNLEKLEKEKAKAEAEEDLALLKAKNSATEKTGRNDPCPCGSGKKYKNCCWRKV